MSTPHHMHFAGHPLRVHQFFDGQLWFDCRDLAKVLDYPDPLEAVSSLCTRNGVHRGSGERPTLLVDLPNTLRLVINSTSPRAAIFEEWLRDDCLKRFFCRLMLPNEGQVLVDGKPMLRLCWNDRYWVPLSEVAEAIGPRLRLKPGQSNLPSFRS